MEFASLTASSKLFHWLVLRRRMLSCQVEDEFVEQCRSMLQRAAEIGSLWQLLDDRAQRCKKACVVDSQAQFEFYTLGHQPVNHCSDHLPIHRLVVQRINEEWPVTKNAKLLKEAYITTLLKPTLDSNDINNFRSISNLSVLSKWLEGSVQASIEYWVTLMSTITCHETNRPIIRTTRPSLHWRK